MPDLERDFDIDLDSDGWPDRLPVDWWLDVVEADARDRDEGFEPDPEDVDWWHAELRKEGP